MAIEPVQAGKISTTNSTNTILGSNAVFSGTAEEVVGYATVSIFVFADQVSATDGLQAQWSSNGANWDDADSYTIPASTGKIFTFGVQSRWFRIVYTNGGTAQVQFRLQTLFHNVITKPSSHRIKDAITTENDAELVLAILSAKASGGNYTTLATLASDPTGAEEGIVTRPVSLGTLTDTAITSDANGTLSGKIRGLVKILADMWDSVNHRMNVFIQNSVLTVQGNQPASVTGTITTSSSTVTASSASNMNVATISVNGTYNGVRFVVEGSDDSGTTWYGLQAVDNATGYLYSGVAPGQNLNCSYDVTIGGFNQFRVRAVAFTSGTANIRISLQAMPYEVAPAVVPSGGSGRVIKLFNAFNFTPATTEAMVTLTPITDGVLGTSATSFAVTAGKRLRIQAMSVVCRDSTTTALGVQVSLRMTQTGTVVSGSALVTTIAAGLVGTQVAQTATSGSIDFPDGLEFHDSMQFGISQIGVATAGASVTLIGYEY